MLLSVTNFPSGATVSYKIINTAGTIVQDWTTTGVVERVIDATAAISLYQIDSGAITSGFEGHVMWKTTASPPLVASETINVQNVNMAQISGDAVAADNLEAQYDGTGYVNVNAPAYQSQASSILAALTPQSFTVAADTYNSVLQVKTNLASTVDDAYKGGWVRFTSGALASLPAKRISTYSGTTKIITFTTSFVSTPADGVTGVIIIG